MTDVSPSRDHVEDGALVRLIDRETSRDEARCIRRHLRTCPECLSRLEKLRGWSRGLEALLREADPVLGPGEAGEPRGSVSPQGETLTSEPDVARSRRRGRGFPWPSGALLRVAAALVLVVSGLAIGPVRAWVWDRVQETVTWVESRTGSDPTAGTHARSSSSTVEFRPAGSRIRISLQEVPDGGSLTILTGNPGGTVRAAIGGDGDAETLVLPDGLRIRNRREGSARYTMHLPRGLEEVVLRAGEREIARLGRDILATRSTRTWRFSPGERIVPAREATPPEK